MKRAKATKKYGPIASAVGAAAKHPQPNVLKHPKGHKGVGLEENQPSAPSLHHSRKASGYC